MAIKKEQYKAFEDILGVENISADPVILDSYAWRSGQVAGPDKFKPRFEAITLPQSTEEVQAIVKLCNKFKLRFKATSTGWGVYCDPTTPGVIRIDLKRMNRILEINEKNMYAVVEPGVIHAQLQAELMKRGMNCNVNGAGGITSALPLAAHEGIVRRRRLLDCLDALAEVDLVRSGEIAREPPQRGRGRLDHVTVRGDRSGGKRPGLTFHGTEDLDL